jgi:hypothetical protein
MPSTFGGPPAAANPLEFFDEPLSGDGAFHQVQHRQPGVFADHRRDLDRLAVDPSSVPSLIYPAPMYQTSAFKLGSTTRREPKFGGIAALTPAE